MTTLEKRVRDYFRRNGYFYTPEMIKSCAEYIERRNSNSDEDEDCYTVLDWAVDTHDNNPEYFMTKQSACELGIEELLKQRDICIDQTGSEPRMADYEMECESETFKRITQEYVTIDDIFNYLLDKVKK